MDAASQEKFLRFKALEQQMQETTQQLEFFEEQTAMLKEAIASLVQLQTLPEGATLYVPLSHGVRVKATLADTQHVMVHVGAQTTVHKTPQQAIELIQQQLTAVEHYAEKLTEKLMQLSQKADQINKQQ